MGGSDDMDKKVSFEVDSDIYEKFCMALSLNTEDKNLAIQNCMKLYIANAFEKASQIYHTKSNTRQPINSDKDFSGKANSRIPVWALKPEQYNHKIIKAYFTALAIADEATIDMMENLCSDKEHPELYVPTFKSNYAQMKIDGAKSHGKVFEDNGEQVWIWNEVEDTLLKYKSSFYNGEV